MYNVRAGNTADSVTHVHCTSRLNFWGFTEIIQGHGVVLREGKHNALTFLPHPLPPTQQNLFPGFTSGFRFYLGDKFIQQESMSFIIILPQRSKLTSQQPCLLSVSKYTINTLSGTFCVFDFPPLDCINLSSLTPINHTF